MAFEIKCESPEVANLARDTIAAYVRRSRFSVEEIYANKSTVIVRTVRLLESKDYCGNHPGPCRAGGNRPHKKAAWLEGADWVAFNDMVNDALDSIGHSGSAGSSLLNIRKGGKRRVSYDYLLGQFGHADWIKVAADSDYSDRRKRKPIKSEYPNGTPGIDTWQADEALASVA